MSKTLLPLLVLLSAASFVSALPPDGVSGAMVLDEVADGLRRYRREKDGNKRAEWLETLAATRDPRVAVLLGETFTYSCSGGEMSRMLYLLGRNFAPLPTPEEHQDPRSAGWRWWARNEADLRRRARERP